MTALVKQFADEPDTCLFGTMSLWQGVDVPGGSCRLVVIDRIPFPRPDDPLMTARSRAVAQAGGNGFMAVSATHAAIRLAQGAGRLIRSNEGQGRGGGAGFPAVHGALRRVPARRTAAVLAHDGPRRSPWRRWKGSPGAPAPEAAAGRAGRLPPAAAAAHRER